MQFLRFHLMVTFAGASPSPQNTHFSNHFPPHTEGESKLKFCEVAAIVIFARDSPSPNELQGFMRPCGCSSAQEDASRILTRISQKFCPKICSEFCLRVLFGPWPNGPVRFSHRL